MTRFLKPARAHSPRLAAAAIAATVGVIAALVVGAAIASTFTLKVARNANVTDQSGTTKSESIVVTTHGFAVYTLSGDSKSHPKCTKRNGCFGVWPPVTVASAKKLSKAPGIKGKLGLWHRNGFLQVTLAGHPLYKFAGDMQRHSATGEGLRSFHGVWHVVKAATSTVGGGTTSTSTTTTSTTTTSCLYPPC